MAGSEVIIRRPRTEEADVLAHLHVRCWQQTYAQLLPTMSLDELLRSKRELWTSLLAQDPLPARMAVAEKDGAPVGFALAGPPQGVPVRDLELYALYLDADHHGGGAGQGLLDAVIGTLPAQLWVAAQNPRALAFYARNGFVPDGGRQVHDLDEIRLVR